MLYKFYYSNNFFTKLSLIFFNVFTTYLNSYKKMLTIMKIIFLKKSNIGNKKKTHIDLMNILTSENLNCRNKISLNV